VLTHSAASFFSENTLYYIDVPYCFKPTAELDGIPRGYEQIHYGFSKENAQNWTQAILCYPSQLSSLFADEQDMVTKILEYFSRNQGIILLRKV